MLNKTICIFVLKCYFTRNLFKKIVKYMIAMSSSQSRYLSDVFRAKVT